MSFSEVHNHLLIQPYLDTGVDRIQSVATKAFAQVHSGHIQICLGLSAWPHCYLSLHHLYTKVAFSMYICSRSFDVTNECTPWFSAILIKVNLIHLARYILFKNIAPRKTNMTLLNLSTHELFPFMDEIYQQYLISPHIREIHLLWPDPLKAFIVKQRHLSFKFLACVFLCVTEEWKRCVLFPELRYILV